jgi:hypothetical protein
MKAFSFRHVLLLATGTIVLCFPTMPAFAQDAEKVKVMQRVIDAQQKQLEDQQKQLDAQRQLLQDLQKQMESLVKDADTEEVPVAAEKPAAKPAVASTKAPPPDKKVVTTGGGERVKLAISGQVNRAVNIVDDGKDTEAYFVDNDNAESRVNFAGTAKVTDDLTLGSMIELTIAPNKASDVSQDNEETGDIFEQRITDVTLDSKRFGKLSLGKGFSAAYGSASRDLSRTDVISYVTIADTAGGMLFRQTDDDTLTDLRINEAFQSFDGLFRVNRVRYDTPTYHGFHLSAAAVSDQRYDAALWWGGKAMASRPSVPWV